MFKEGVQNRINWLAGLALVVVTVGVTPSSTLDPINVPKLWFLTVFSFAILALIFQNPKNLLSKGNLVFTISAMTLPAVMLVTTFLSDAPLTQQLFGTYGRNTGLLYYFGLSILFLSVAIGSNQTFKKIFMYAVVGTLIINLTYGFIQSIGRDWINWNSAYSPVFGTFGNPDFVSAFLGFMSAFAFAYLFARISSKKIKLLSFVVLSITIYVIMKTQAQQGLIIIVLVLAIVLYFEIRNYLNSIIIQLVYLVAFLVVGLFTLVGTLQKGPLSDFLYKSSVTQRGDYWHSGISMLWSKPFTGVGLDSYGDWYRYFRTSAAAGRFEGTAVSNSAHNVFIDIAATSGVFAILAYFFIIVLALRASWHIYSSNPKLDPFFIGVFAAWIGYLAQSAISINNIGLGIWGWVFPGILIAISRWQHEDLNSKKISKPVKVKMDFSGMFMMSGLIVGLVIGFIPFNADANFRHALKSGDSNKIYVAALKWPADTSRMIYTAKLFQSNKLDEEAEYLGRNSVKINPRSFEGWQFLYEFPSIKGAEKSRILNKLQSLDPNNRNLE